MSWQPATRRQWYRLTITALALALVGAGALAGMTATADATVSVGTESLDVADVNKTVSGNVTDATLTTTLGYETTVPGAQRRIIRLKAGPSSDQLALVDYVQREVDSGSTSGTVTLSGSLVNDAGIALSSLDPAHAGTTTTDVVVQASIEVTRADADSVTHTATETVTLRLSDDGQVVAVVGGTGEITVQTDA